MTLKVPVWWLVCAVVCIGATGFWVMWAPSAPVVDVPPPRKYELPERDQAALRHAIALLAWKASGGGRRDLAFGRELAQTARYHLLVRPRGFRDDCSGFVSAVYTNSGVPMDGVVASLYDLAVVHNALHWRPTPEIGDLVFFDNTNDRNRNGEWDDMNTHIGLVVDVEPDGTTVFAHSGTSKGRALGRINVARSGSYKDDDKSILNDYLRAPERGDPPTAGYLTGELWSAFATIDPTLDWKTDPPPPEAWP